jgi:hypothetical protein
VDIITKADAIPDVYHIKITVEYGIHASTLHTVTSKYSTQSVSAQLSLKKMKTSKYGKVVSVFSEWFWQNMLFMYQLCL